LFRSPHRFWGITSATSAYVADIIPQNRWGEALGMHGLCFSIGGAVGPAIGSYIALQYGINTMFYSSSLFALLSIVIVMKMRETLASRQRFAVGMLKINKQEIIEWRATGCCRDTSLLYSVRRHSNADSRLE